MRGPPAIHRWARSSRPSGTGLGRQLEWSAVWIAAIRESCPGASQPLLLGGEGEERFGIGEGDPEWLELGDILIGAREWGEVVQRHEEVELEASPMDAIVVELDLLLAQVRQEAGVGDAALLTGFPERGRFVGFSCLDMSLRK